MNKVVFIFFFIGNLVFVNIANGQDYFNLRYGHDSLQDVGKTILTVDTGYYVLNYRFVDWNNSKVNLTFIDTIGNIKWQKSYGQPGIWYSGGRSGKQLILSPDKKKMYFTCTGIDSLNRYFGTLWAFNRNGDSLLCKYYGDSLAFYSNNHCQLTFDSCIIIAGAMDNGTTQAMLIKVDSLGNKLWEQNYGGTGEEYGCSVLQTSDNGYIMGITTTSFGGDVDMAVIKTDSNGVQQWLQPYAGNYSEALPAYIIPLSDGNFALCGGLGSSMSSYGWPRIIKINPSGSVIWDKKYGGEYWGSLASSIIEDSNGNIVCAGSANSKGIIFKVDINGDSLWYRNLQHTSINNPLTTNILWAIDTAINGGYISAGVIYPSSPDTGSVDTWVIKVDEYGCDTLNCQFVSVVENEMGKGRIRVYPNPTNADLNLEMDELLFREGDFSLELFDFTGKKLFSQTINNFLESVSLINYSSGIYFLIVQKDGLIIDRIKVIKE